MPKPIAGHRQKPAITRAVQQDLRHRQTDDLRVTRPGRAPNPTPLGQGIVHQHVKCREQGVEVGVHEASKVDVARATPTSAPLLRTLAPTPNMESTI